MDGCSVRKLVASLNVDKQLNLLARSAAAAIANGRQQRRDLEYGFDETEFRKSLGELYAKAKG